MTKTMKYDTNNEVAKLQRDIQKKLPEHIRVEVAEDQNPGFYLIRGTVVITAEAAVSKDIAQGRKSMLKNPASYIASMMKDQFKGIKRLVI